MIEIPVNTYKVETDPRVEEIIGKCLKKLSAKGEALIDMHPLNDYYRNDPNGICCEGDGNEAIVREVFKHFLKAGYHCEIYHNGCVYLWAQISKKPYSRGAYGVEIVG